MARTKHLAKKLWGLAKKALRWEIEIWKAQKGKKSPRGASGSTLNLSLRITGDRQLAQLYAHGRNSLKPPAFSLYILQIACIVEFGT